MTRRALFGLMAAAALDPEKLLWVPGKKLISIPKPGPKLGDESWVRVTYCDEQTSVITAGRFPLILQHRGQTVFLKWQSFAAYRPGL